MANYTWSVKSRRVYEWRTSGHPLIDGAGGPFRFRAYPAGKPRPAEVTWDVVDYRSWLKLLDLGEVRAEYGMVFTSAEMVDVIEEMRGHRQHALFRNQVRDASGNTFTTVWFC